MCSYGELILRRNILGRHFLYMSSIQHCLVVQIHNDKTPLLCLVSFSNASFSPAAIHTLQRYTPWICRAWLPSLSSFLRLYCSPPLLTISKSCGSRGRASLLLPQDKESNHKKNPVPVLGISQRLRHITEQRTKCMAAKNPIQ